MVKHLGLYLKALGVEMLRFFLKLSTVFFYPSYATFQTENILMFQITLCIL